jgi:Na+-transporting NADH:ubiquinone oxidoreductase subunit NqrE
MLLRATIVVTVVLWTIFMVVVVRDCAFLRPVMGAIWRDYQTPALLFFLLFLVNAGAAVYGVLRRILLADTGDKLAYIERQLRGRGTISKELTERILNDR